MADGVTVTFVSIVIATYNRRIQLRECLTSLTTLTYPREAFEVIVVDDGSSVPLDDVVDPFRGRLDLKLLTESHGGPGAARNAGAAQARGELIAFIDDDCRADPEWLRLLVERCSEAPAAMVGGRIINGLPDNIYSEASQHLAGFLYDHYNPRPEDARFFTTNNMAVPTELFHQLGGFDITHIQNGTSEDRALCDKWWHRGYPLVYTPDAVVYHAHALTPITFWRQHFSYGRGAYNFRRQRAQWTGSSVPFEGLSFYLRLVLSPLGRPHAVNTWLLAVLLAVTQVANVAGFCSKVIERYAASR